MGLLQEFRTRARYVLAPPLCLLAVGCVAYHVVQADRGLFAWWNIKQRVGAAKAALEVLQGERELLENRVRLLNPGSLDLDMLEERALLMLNYGHDDDIVILEKKKRRK